jgi:DNA-directed RNA polymerase specialized sigma24 family protein
MKITQEMIEFAEAQKWDEDLKQDMYVKLLEQPDDYMEGVGVESLMTQVYNRNVIDGARKEARRKELVQENVQAIEALHGTDDIHDPIEYLAVDNLFSRMHCLSPLLYNTLQDYVYGASIQEIAEKNNVDANTIYQRIHAIKKELHNV